MRKLAKRSESVTRILTQPWGFVLGVNCFIVGLALALTLLFHDTKVLTSVQGLPTPLSIAWAFGFVVGGAALAVSVLWYGSGYVGRAIERSALYLVGSSLMAYAIALVYLFGTISALPAALATSLSLGCGLRHHALKRIEDAVCTITNESSS